MRILRLIAFMALAAGTCPAVGIALSGAVLFESSSSTSGSCTNLANCDFWNTVGGDSTFNLYFQKSGSFINSGDGASTSINSLLLEPGVNTFTVFGDNTGRFTNLGLNLYFNNSTTPGISSDGTVAFSTTAPLFSADSAASTISLTGGFQPGAGTLSFVTGIGGAFTVTLTSFYWDDPSVQNLDQVSPFAGTSNGTKDSVGSITLTVTDNGAPEPASFLLGGAGLVFLAWWWRRRSADVA